MCVCVCGCVLSQDKKSVNRDILHKWQVKVAGRFGGNHKASWIVLPILSGHLGRHSGGLVAGANPGQFGS